MAYIDNRNIEKPKQRRGRPRTWKTVTDLLSYDDRRRLQACYGSSRGIFDRYTIFMEGSWLETDMPWSELRALFSFADVPLRQNKILTDDIPTWERHPDEDE